MNFEEMMNESVGVNDGSSTNHRNGETQPTISQKTDVCLPGDNYIIQSWKVRSGSVVRVGETVAIAVQQAAASNHPIPSATSVPAYADAAASGSSPTAATHKRPSKRRRLNANAATSGSQAQANIKSNVASSGKSFAERYSVSAPKSKQQQQPGIASASLGGSTNKEKADRGNVSDTIPVLATANGFLRPGSQNPESENVKDDTKKKLVIGFIEECLHPGLFGGLCIACGQKVQQKGQLSPDSNDGNAMDVGAMSSPALNQSGGTQLRPQQASKTRPQHIMVTVSGGITMKVSESEGRDMAEQTSRRLWKLKKLSLVLDLDHTLVHATPDHRARLYCTAQHGDVRTLLLPSMEVPPSSSNATPAVRMVGMQHFVKLRPHIKEFFQDVQPMYEVTVYTAGTRQYAEEITIVLCRYIVGAVLDNVELEHLRFTVRSATNEYEKMYGAGSIAPSENNSVSTGKHKLEQGADSEALSTENAAPALDAVDADSSSASASAKAKATKKSVSFGPPARDKDASGASSSGARCDQSDPPQEVSSLSNRSDHITLEQLNKLRRELEGAEKLETEARELRQKLFGSRVVSRTDVGDLGRDVKSLKRIFPCGGTMAAVVDDREDVWANAADNSATTKKGEPPANLLLVRPYHWKPFVGFADVNNAAGTDLSASSSDKTSSGNNGAGKETDVQLLWTSEILKKLHARYYNTKGEDGVISNEAVATQRRQRPVPKILTEMRHEVLNGSTLVLSGLVPMHQKKTTVGQPRLPIIRYAETLGAKVCYLGAALVA